MWWNICLYTGKYSDAATNEPWTIFFAVRSINDHLRVQVKQWNPFRSWNIELEMFLKTPKLTNELFIFNGTLRDFILCWITLNSKVLSLYNS